MQAYRLLKPKKLVHLTLYENSLSYVYINFLVICIMFINFTAKIFLYIQQHLYVEKQHYGYKKPILMNKKQIL